MVVVVVDGVLEVDVLVLEEVVLVVVVTELVVTGWSDGTLLSGTGFTVATGAGDANATGVASGFGFAAGSGRVGIGATTAGLLTGLGALVELCSLVVVTFIIGRGVSKAEAIKTTNVNDTINTRWLNLWMFFNCLSSLINNLVTNIFAVFFD